MVVELDRGPAAPSVARRLVRDRAEGFLPRDRMADLCLVVSELVTNALNHGSGAIRLVLLRDGDRLRGEVTDEGSGFEVELRERGLEEVGGRGLMVVSGVSERWGVYDGSSHVWFELGLAATAGVELRPPVLGSRAAPDA